MSPRSKINSVRDYEQFLRARGFSKKEALQLSTAFKLLNRKQPGREVSGLDNKP